MFCTKCGKEISEKLTYCEYCGNQLLKSKKNNNLVYIIALLLGVGIIITVISIQKKGINSDPKLKQSTNKPVDKQKKTEEGIKNYLKTTGEEIKRIENADINGKKIVAVTQNTFIDSMTSGKTLATNLYIFEQGFFGDIKEKYNNKNIAIEPGFACALADLIIGDVNEDGINEISVLILQMGLKGTNHPVGRYNLIIFLFNYNICKELYNIKVVSMDERGADNKSLANNLISQLRQSTDKIKTIKQLISLDRSSFEVFEKY